MGLDSGGDVNGYLDSSLKISSFTVEESRLTLMNW
ncbi:hypothetical protein LINPERHAP2_LOCUS14433 [Linum perenne]